MSQQALTNNLHSLDLTISRVISLNRAHPIAGEIMVRLQLNGTMPELGTIGDDERRVDVVFEDALRRRKLEMCREFPIDFPTNMKGFLGGIH